MAAIHLRQDKERPLTIEEVDQNFYEINQEVGTKLNSSAFTASNILTILEGNAGTGSTLDADVLRGEEPNVAAVPNTIVSRNGLGNVYANQFHGTHVGAVVGNVTGNVTGTLTGNSSNVSGTVQIDHGGTGAVTATSARANLGIGTLGTQAADAVAITGGDITGITDLAIADGGTGASTASGARTNLGLVIGSQIQAYDAILTGLSQTSDHGWIGRNDNDTAYVRSFVAGNSIEITNADGVDGDPTFALTLTPSVNGITKLGDSGTGNLGQSNNVWGNVYATTMHMGSITKTGTNGSGDIGQSNNRYNNCHIQSLGVGTGASGTAGEIRATNNVTAYYSDERLKTKLGGIENALDKVESLSGFYYEPNEIAQELGYEVHREVGLSAQEVESVMPEIVAPAPIDDKYLTVRYERLAPLFVEAIKELRSEIREIKTQLAMKD